MKLILINILFQLFLNFSYIQAQENVKPGFKCYMCNNKDNPNCLNKLESLNDTYTCNPEGNTECVTYIDPNNRYLYRDCKSNFKNPECKSSTCISCSNKEKCNDQKNFPDNRQQCYMCNENDENCFTKPNEKIKFDYCPQYPDKCFTYVNDNKKTIRDCLSNQNPNNICTNSKECVTCDNKSKCNDDNGEIELKCYECNGNDENCKGKYETENCLINSDYKKLCKKFLLGRDIPEDVCYIKQNGNNVERGCYLTKQSIIIERNSTLRKTKSEDNGKCLLDLECIKCTPDNEKCAIDNDDLKSLAKKCVQYTTSCYRYDDKDGKTTRDCGEPSNDKIQNTSFCYDNKCIAKKLKIYCYNCDSENDENCVQLKNLEQLKKKECDNNDGCVTMIKENGHTVRGCKNDILGNKDCTNDKLCHVCSAKVSDVVPCNGAIFPLNRLQCYQCANCNDIGKKDQQQQSYPCRIYKEDDKCYMYANDKNDITRGCISDKNGNETCKNANEKCHQCATNNCNDYGKMKDPTLKCIKCNSTSSDDCKWGYNENQAANCKNQLEFWKMEKCYVCNSDGKVIRGCESDSSTALTDKCKMCATDGCNNYQETNFTCIRCRSDNDGQESCAKNAEGIQPSNCTNSVSKANRGCFTDRNVNTGVVIRGCLVDFYITDRLKCLDNSYEYCKSCFESNCNNHEISGSIKTVSISVTSIFLSISIINFIIN